VIKADALHPNAIVLHGALVRGSVKHTDYLLLNCTDDSPWIASVIGFWEGNYQVEIASVSREGSLVAIGIAGVSRIRDEQFQFPNPSAFDSFLHAGHVKLGVAYVFNSNGIR
jgi:hypothetical protein